MTDDGRRQAGTAARAGLILGPVAATIIFLLLPSSYADIDGVLTQLSPAAKASAAIAVMMAIWWMTEAISVYATALVPLALFPLLGIADIDVTAAAYGNKIIYLFLGGFVVALALEKWGLHKRLALSVLSAVGPQPGSIIAAFMFVSALLSMWVTNTATTIMLLPVAVSVIRLLPDADLDDGKADSSFSICLLLGIAYASSIGGMGTIIGTAPNVFVVSYLKEQLDIEISFLQWMQFALPLVIVFVPVAWFILTRIVYRVSRDPIPGAMQLLQREHDGLEPLSRGAILTLCIFFMTALAWITRPLLNRMEIAGVQPLEGLTDPGIAIFAAIVLFVTPASIKGRQFLMDWPTAIRLPWGLLILFGGGLALAAALVETGFSHYMGNMASGLSGWPIWLVVMVVTATVVFLTELTSNTATTATIVPVLMAVAIGLGLPPLLLILPAAFAASSAFMLPVATPPNAIVFGSDLLTISQMCRAGLWLNIVAIFLITLAVYAIIGPALGIVL